jgi:hypothetical protein
LFNLRLVSFRLGLVLALLPFLLLAAYNHPFLDDYLNATKVHTEGLAAAQLDWYYKWTGRYASTFFLTALNPLTYGWLAGVKVTAALLLGLNWLSIAGLLRTVFHLGFRLACSWRTAGWAAAALLALFCNAAPEPYSFIYWFTGAAVYQLPYLGLINFTSLAVVAGWGPARMRTLAALLALPCLVLAVAGNELVLLQTLVVLAVLGLRLPPDRRAAWWAWLLLGLVAGALSLAAPGNWLRAAQTYPGDHSQRWLLLLPRAAYSGILFLLKPMVSGSLVAALLTGLTLGRAAGAPAAGTRTSWSLPEWGGLLLAFGALNSVGFVLFRYVWIEAPVLRAQNEMLLLLLVSAAALGWVMATQQPGGILAGRRLRWALPLLLLALFTTGHVRHAWLELLTTAPAYEAQMQARYATMRQAHRAGQPAVLLPPLQLAHGRVLAPLRDGSYPADFSVDLSPGCSGNSNAVLAHYFGLRRVCLSHDDHIDTPLAAPLKR